MRAGPPPRAAAAPMRDQALSPLATALPGPTRRRAARPRLIGFARRRPSFLLGLAIVALTLFLAVFGPLVAPYHPGARAGRGRASAALARALDGH